jgi:DNA-binding transcriptional regulator LsrR (DeoR family)
MGEKMKARYDIQLMVQVAKMYYVGGLTQEQIAKEFGISRSSISMILYEAKEMGIVQISVKDPKSNVVELADELIDIFGLKGAIVIQTAIHDLRLLTKVVASQGADYAQDILRSHNTVGIAWGMTCYEFMLSFNNWNKLHDIKVVPLIGGTSRISSEYQLNEMVRMFAERVQGTPSFIYAPAIAESIDDKELYMQSMSMKGIIEKWNVMDVAIVSAGAPPELYQKKVNIDAKQMSLFEADETKAVGDICARRFNLKGRFIKNDYSMHIMGIDEDNLRRIDNVICIAAGQQKILSIIGALRTGVIDFLVTDENTASGVLSLIKPSKARDYLSNGQTKNGFVRDAFAAL